MIVRMARTKELEKCVKHSIWGAHKSLSKWQIGDILILYVDKKLAAVAEVNGEAFRDNTPIWGNGVFPCRIPVKFNYVLPKDKMIPFDSEIVGTLMDEWGFYYSWGIIRNRPLSKKAAEKLIGMIEEKAGK